MSLRLLTSLVVLAGLTLAQAQDRPAIEMTKTYHFKISPKDKGYRLAAEVSLKETLLNQAACGRRLFRIVAPEYAAITSLRATRNDNPLPGEKITSYYPQPRGIFIDTGKVHELDFSGGLKPGDRLGCTYTQDFQDPALFPLVNIPALDRVARFEIQVEHPAELRVDFTVFQPHGALDPAIERRDPTHTCISFRDLPGPDALAQDPFDELAAGVLTRITRGGIPVTGHTPESFMQWFQAQVGPEPPPTEAMAGLLKDELDRAPTPLEKTRILFDYVKSKVRYVADEGQGHAYVPHAPQQVLERKWGDCKDKAWLLQTLARLHGLPVHMALVCTEVQPEIGELNTGMYDHAICALDEGGGMVFMDPTDAESELGDPPDWDLLGRAFLLDPRQPRSVVVPDRKATPDLTLSIEADLADARHAKATVVLRHTLKSRALRARKRDNASDFDRYLGELLNPRLNRLSLDGFRVRREDRDELELEARADLGEFPVLGEQRAYVPATVFRAVAPGLLDREKDSGFIEAKGPESYQLNLTLKAAGYSPRAERLAQGAEGGPFHEASCAGEAGTASLQYRFRQPYRLVPAGEREGFLRFCRQYLGQNQSFFTLTRSGS